MNLINIVPSHSNARDEIAALSPSEIAELEAWFSWVSESNDKAEGITRSA